MVGDNTTASRMSRNKAALRNKLLKNAKSIQRNRCRIDNISAVIESVVKNHNAEEKKSQDEKSDEEKSDIKKDAKEKGEESGRKETVIDEKSTRTKFRGPRVLSKKRNVKTKEGTLRTEDQPRKMGHMKAKVKSMSKNASETKSHSLEETSDTPKSIKVSPKGAEKEADEVSPATSPEELKSPSPSAKNKSSVQTTPKRKRPVDPVASLNASIKARSQLRTQDGKFARNPNKSLSPQKSPELRPPTGRQLIKGKSNETGLEPSVTRSKFRAVSRSKNDDQLPKRNTRLSSDSDKMPTLEPAVQVTSSNEEYVDTAVNDLPILSPATSSFSSEKTLRGRSLVSKNLEEKDNLKKGSESEEVEEKNEVAGDREENREQKQGKTRRMKSDGKNLEKSLKNIVGKGDVPKEKPKGIMKEKLKRKSAPGRIPSAEERKASGSKSPEETRKELKQKEDGTMKTLETRGNSRTKLDKILDVDGEIKIQNVPFEVKKLIGSNSKEDLLTTLVLTSRTASSKRCLRQTAPKANLEQGKSKTRTDSEADKASLDSELSSTTSTGSGKRDTGFRRKSLRNTEKKVEDKIAPKDDKSIAEEANKMRNATNEIKIVIRGRRSNSLSGENKSVISATQVSASESQNKAETEFIVQNADNESSSNKRQTRGSVLNSEPDVQGKETSSEQHNVSLERSSHLGKRRGRIKSNNDIPDKSNSEITPGKNEEFVKNNSTEITSDKINTVEENKTNSVDKEATIPEDNVPRDKEEKDKSMVKAGQMEDASMKSAETPNANLSLSHLQLETSSSMDSGKENSLETVVGVQKLKVGRPRKSWGSRRERTSKRSLNNVIGILTEGMNIPVESQQSVVLTVQTTLDNASSDEAVQNNTQQSDDGSSRSVNLDKTDKTPEAANVIDDIVEEAQSCVQTQEVLKQLQTVDVSLKDLNMEDSLANTQKVDSSSNDIKERSPTTDIILDLSRRKTKGKGSFLEKIVSKIAKQKDALLEGEVGSLLDTAADELTSILDEVGPGLSETTENLTDLKNEVSKSKIEERAQDSAQEVNEKSVDKDFSLTNNSSDKKLENRDSSINTSEAVGNEEKKTVLKEGESPKEIINNSESINQKEIKDERLGQLNQEITDRQTNISEVQEDANSDNLTLADRVTPVENNSTVSNGILLSISEGVSDSALNCSAEACLTKQDDKLVKRDDEAVIEGSKSKKKSKKRSFEGNSPKKNKRKTVEPEEESEENLIPEELHFADIMKLIDKSKQVPFTKENAEDAETDIERVQPGKRKPENSDPAVKDLIDNKISEHIQICEDFTNGGKKIKIDFQKDAKESAEANQDDKIVTGKHSVENLVNESNDKICINNVEMQPPLIHIAETDISVKRTSKRRSVLEEKATQPSEEEMLAKVLLSATETILGNSRRRSSRTKSTIQQKNEEKSKETLDDFASDMSNAVVTDTSELPLNTAADKDESLKNDASLIQTTAAAVTEEANKVEENSTPNTIKSQEARKDEVVESVPETVLDAPIIPKVAKKRGRKKKVLANEQAQIINDSSKENSTSKTEADPVEAEPVVPSEIPGRKSLRTSRSTEEIEKESKNSSSTTTSHIPSPSMEHFKIPEVTDVLQHTKKRTSKKKSVTDEHLDTQSVLPSVESEGHSAEYSEISRAFAEKEERLENKEDSGIGKKRLSRNSNKEKLELERSSSSGSIDFAQSNRTRSSKRKQLSSEDILNQEGLNHRAESVDSLSETSVVSESCYFRKKRFSKKKKGFQAPPEDVQTDTSITDSESIDTERNTDRRQSLKRRAKKNISFFELQFDLVDDFDISMDIEECLQPEDKLKDGSQEVEPKSSQVEDKVDNETALNDTSDREREEDKTVADPKQTVEGEEEEGSEEAENADDKADTTPEVQEDFQTPKKRAAGNFVVVHKKTGEILIVEKRKKLTKEAAKFFCDVCATSFTRKSSLKKHNLSQSHLLQLVKFKKDKAFSENIEDACNASLKEVSDQNETSNEEDRSVTNELMNMSEESREEQKDLKYDSKDLEADRNIPSTRTSIEQESFIASQTTHQRIVEDELLDEEICKITENMSHDEYVLTEHTSPGPESSSTPINMEPTVIEDATKKKKHDKKKEKTKKKSLIDEHLALETPNPKSPLNLTSGSLISVLGSNMSIKISKFSHLSTSEFPASKPQIIECAETVSLLEDSSNNLESRTDVSALKEVSFQEKCSPDAVISRKNQNLDMELENVIESIEQAKERSMEVELDEDISEMVKIIPKSISDDKIVSKENQPLERISLKLTINKRSLGQFNEANIEVNRGLDLNCSQKSENIKSLSSYGSQKHKAYTADTDYLNLKTTDLISTLPKSLEEESKINLDNAIRDSNVSTETLQSMDILKTLEKVDVEASQTVQNNFYDRQTPLVTENIIEDIPGLQIESHRMPRHSKSKKNKAKEHVEEIENVSADSLATRKTSKSKGNQHRQHLNEVMRPSGSAKNEESSKCSETFECKVADETVNKKSEILENNSDRVNNLAGFTEPETAAKHRFSALDILENQKNNENRQTTMAGEKHDKIDSESKTKCEITFEDDGDSLSSIEDKPLSQVLLKVDEILREDRKKRRDHNVSVNSLECLKESKLEDKQSKATFDFVENTMINNQNPDSGELINGEQVELQIPCEKEGKSEPLNSVKTSDMDAEASLGSENSEAIQQIKRIPSEKEAKTTSNDRKSSGKKVSKSHKHSSKESHRKIRNKKTSLKSKIADLISESDDSEYEDKIESQNKSKIVKSVFGRVFGTEKADKVKEVLNDWVSKSEDDSDVSRTDLKSFSPNNLKTKEVSEVKSEEKNAEKQTTSHVLTSPKKSGKKSKKNCSLDRGKEKNLEPEDQEDLRSDKHTELQSNSSNCRKNNVDMELLSRRHCAGETLPPTSHRSSKKKAKKRFSEELLAFDTFFNCMEGKFNWGSKSEDDSDVSRSEPKPSSPNELKTREISEARTQHDMERQTNASPTSSSSKKRSGKKSKRSSSEKTKEKDSMSEIQEDHRSDKGAILKNSSSDRRRNNMDSEDDVSEITSPTTHRSSKKKAKKRLSDSHLPHGTSFECMEPKYNWGSNSKDDSDALKTEFKHSSSGASKARESEEVRSEERDIEKQSASCVSTSSKKSAKKSKKSSSSDRAKEKNLVAENQEDSCSDKHTESQNNINNHEKSNADMELLFRQHCVDEILSPTSCRSNKKKTKKRISKDPLSLGSLFERMESKFNWGSKSEGDSDNDESSSPSELKIREIAEARNEKNMERQSNLSVTSSPKKRSGKKSRKSSYSDKTKEKNSVSENLEDHRANKHAEPKNNLTNRKKNDVNAEVNMGEILPSTCHRNSKKRAEEKISKSFLPLDYIYESKESSELRNQKSDLSVKDSGYGSFNCDEDSSKFVSSETSAEKNPKVTKKRKSDDPAVEKKTTKNSKESDNEDGSSVKDFPRGENLTNVLSVDLESSRSCSSLALSSVRNRSPSMDRNSQTTKDSDIDEDRDEENMGHRRISPLFVCGTPRSSIDNSSNSENEEEDEKVSASGTVACKRSSSEFSGEKIVIRSPSSTHKSEVVTITPTDAIEDNALDVPQEIEIAKPRQGKVLNFDEELFVECCSRLKATTENELRGAKKIKLDHNEGYHKKEDQQERFKGPRDRWRDVESQNSLGSLLESVNQVSIYLEWFDKFACS